jgi:serine/threonine-protein kinase
MTPTSIGRYSIDRLLGQGGMGIVYLAQDPQFGRQVVIKTLPVHLATDDQFRTRFEREARVIAALEHISIVPVYDFGEDDAQLYLVMRYMSGGSLADRLSEEPWSPNQSLEILERLAPALDYAHNQGVIHRDLKPDNILFDQHANPFLSDFGIAKLTEVSTLITQGLIGTPTYMSPEQFQMGVQVDARSDVYSLAAMTYRLLTGRILFGQARDAIAMGIAHRYSEPPMLRSINSRLPAQIEPVFQAALAKDPGDRPISASAFVEALGRSLTKKQGQPIVLPNRSPAALEATLVEPEIAEKELNPPLEPFIPGPLPEIGPGRNKWASCSLVGAGLLLVAICLIAGVAGLNALPSEKTATPTLVEASESPTDSPLSPVPELTEPAPPTSEPTRTATASPPPSATPLAEVMVSIPAGSFSMGGTMWRNEMPVHTVNLDEFLIDVFEVTNAQFQACVEAGACQNNGRFRLTDPDLEDHPMVLVSWDEARDYCTWRDARLPTEAEWEKAARGGLAGQAYPWGSDLTGDRANFCDLNCDGSATLDDGFTESAPVGSYVPNDFGLYDMAGNAMEWVMDFYLDSFYAISPLENPTGPTQGNENVVRGGSFFQETLFLRVAGRSPTGPQSVSWDLGFRCARTP